jgi:hypothetical protein
MILSDRAQLMSVLKPNQQRDIYAFFEPTKDLTDQQLREHRRTSTEQQPSLPAKAGKLITRVKKVNDIATEAEAAEHSYNDIIDYFTPTPQLDMSIVRDHPNVKKLAWAFINLARSEQHERERKEAA